MSFEERRARVFKSLLLIPSRREQYMRQAKCSRKREYLNSAKMQIQAPSMLTSSVLKEFQQQYPRFRCSVGMKHRRVQTRPGGTSGKGLTERHHKTPQASEPEPKPQISPQLTEQLSIAEIHQETIRVQMHRKTTASELC